MRNNRARVAYKFVPAKFAADFASGIVRVSPAHEFRRPDGKDGGQSDPYELADLGKVDGDGVLDISHILHPGTWFLRQPDGNWQNMPVQVTGDTIVKYRDGAFFCMSNTDDAETRTRMRSEFGADAVFEISDVYELARFLGRTAMLDGQPFEIGDVEYADELAQPLNDVIFSNPFV